MQEYTADLKLGKKLYREKRTCYKRYKMGMRVLFVLFVCMILGNLWLVSHAENATQVMENFIIGIGFSMPFIVIAFLVRAFAISGGREVLRSRLAERCWFTPNSFVLEYVPHTHETRIYERISFEIPYTNITQIVDETQVGRIAVYGTYTVSKYRNGAFADGAEQSTVSDMPIYVYGYYRDYATLKQQLLQHTQKG